jgi:hypothetical protein
LNTNSFAFLFGLGFPRLLRVDPGTENGILCAIHATLREDAADELRGKKSYRYGKSTSNQVSPLPFFSYIKKKLL